MAVEEAFQMTVQIALEDWDDEEVHSLAVQLAGELGDQPVESVELARAGAAPVGTKSPEAITLGAVAVAVLPSVLPKVVEFCQAWALRGQGRTVKFEGKIHGQDIKFEGTADELQRLLAQLSSPPPAGNPA
ncbi:MAG TPA: hypothetical protein VIS10_14795 [Anaerolineales bacterium]